MTSPLQMFQPRGLWNRDKSSYKNLPPHCNTQTIHNNFLNSNCRIDWNLKPAQYMWTFDAPHLANFVQRTHLPSGPQSLPSIWPVRQISYGVLQSGFAWLSIVRTLACARVGVSLLLVRKAMWWWAGKSVDAAQLERADRRRVAKSAKARDSISEAV